MNECENKYIAEIELPIYPPVYGYIISCDAI